MTKIRETGSIAPLRPYYPTLDNLPVHIRQDGKEVRYHKIPHPSMNSAPIRSIVFPQYTPGATTQLQPVTKALALEKLALCGSSERPLTLADTQSMINLIEQTPCYQLQYSHLTEAMASINKLNGESTKQEHCKSNNP